MFYYLVQDLKVRRASCFHSSPGLTRARSASYSLLSRFISRSSRCNQLSHRYRHENETVHPAGRYTLCFALRVFGIGVRPGSS